MSKIELFTPNFEKVGSVAREELEDYLKRENLTYRKSKDAEVYIVFKKSLEPMLAAIELGQIKLVNNFELAKKVSENLQFEDRMFAFAASKTLLRGCKTKEGAILALQNMATKLIGDRRVICLPPGCYGEQFLFVICLNYWQDNKEMN